jgi:DNA-binding beta-propeller fold protein YncE
MKRTLLLAAVATLIPISASAQIAVSANDGKQLRPGEAATTRTPDTVATIDLRSYPPKAIGAVQVPASMIGPPTSVAVARDGGFALVTASQRLNAAGELELNDTLSVIDLRDPKAPRLLQTIQAGPGASGVTINRAGTLALVASTGDDSISIFSIAGKHLTAEGKVQLPAKSRPTDVDFAPSGKAALAVAQNAGQLIGLSVAGKAVTIDGSVNVGVQPYGVAYSPDGRFAYNTNLGGRVQPAGAPKTTGPRIGTITAVDLKTKAVTTIDVGLTPEHLTLSPDGKYMAAVIANGSAATPGSPGYSEFGLLKLFKVDGMSLTPIAEAHSGGWCQGAIFSSDARRVLLQCGMPRDIEVYRFDGKSLVRDEAATLKFDSRPGAIASATSR